MPEYSTYSVSRRQRAPLLDYICSGLEVAGCSIIRRSDPSTAPFRVSFVSPDGIRMGIVAYAFYANAKRTRNRPVDEWRFQIKYGTKSGVLHNIWQDPYGLYTTLFLGINPEEDIFAAVDPVLNSPTRFFISKEFKEKYVQEIKQRGWAVWERESRAGRSSDSFEGFETVVGGNRESFFRYVLFEREALGEDQGTRFRLGDRFRGGIPSGLASMLVSSSGTRRADSDALDALVEEFQLPETEIFEIIESAPRLKMAVRGWVAERHLERLLATVPDVSDLEALEADGRPDFSLRFKTRGPITIECKNVLRVVRKDGLPRLDFQRTRAAKGDPCSRYYAPTEFDVTAACLHSITDAWEYRAKVTRAMRPHPSCLDRLDHRVSIGSDWSGDLESVLAEAVGL